MDGNLRDSFHVNCWPEVSQLLTCSIVINAAVNLLSLSDVPHEVEVNQVGVSGCPNLSNVSNGFVVYSPIGFEPFRPDTEATLMCNLGYTPHGNMVSKCSTDGSWSEIGGCYTPSSQQCLQLNEPLNGQVIVISQTGYSIHFYLLLFTITLFPF